MLKELKTLQTDLLQLRRDVKVQEKERITKKELRKSAERLGTLWFQEISPSLVNRSKLAKEVLELYSEGFGHLIKLSAPNNRKKSYLVTLSKLLQDFRDDLILPLQKSPLEVPSLLLLNDVFSGFLSEEESFYLTEAISCAKKLFFRAAVVLGWCAAIDRVQRSIKRTGFKIFNDACAMMAAQTKGRFKRFNARQNVNSLSELREVPDSVILWGLEGMQLIEINEHARLKGCLELRTQCAHPSDAPVTEFNLLAFFSDIGEIVFKNPKFAI